MAGSARGCAHGAARNAPGANNASPPDRALAQHSPVMAGGIRDIPTADEAERFVDACMVLVPKRRNAMSGGAGPPSTGVFALPNRTVRRASMSFFSSSVLRCLRAATGVLSTNCPDMAI